MYIQDNRKPEDSKLLKDVDIGECFQQIGNSDYINDVFMKTDSRKEELFSEYGKEPCCKAIWDCVNMESGAWIEFKEDTRVVQLDTKLVLQTI